jgi:hypothetical protein
LVKDAVLYRASLVADLSAGYSVFRAQSHRRLYDRARNGTTIHALNGGMRISCVEPTQVQGILEQLALLSPLAKSLPVPARDFTA